MKNIRLFLAIGLVVSALFCVSIAFAKPKLTEENVRVLCAAKQSKALSDCIRSAPRYSSGCVEEANKVYAFCMALHGYVTRRGPGDVGDLHDRVDNLPTTKTTGNSTGTHAKQAKQKDGSKSSSTTSSPAARSTPSAKRTPNSK